MSQTVIRCEKIGKRYRLGVSKERYRTLRETMTGLVKPSRWGSRTTASAPKQLWALKDVSLEIKRGEVLGIIGRNGSGKSTLLKVLSRITEPTAGFAEVRGRVGLLLEVGTGFHNELTGRENVYLSGAILGMKRGEIRQKFDQIVDFAEVTDFVDTPLKHYSTGMYLRLAFAVAAHLEPAILMVDEVLAVGDLAFQAKCLGKMQEVGNTGRTVIFVSHDLTAIARLAPRTILLQSGRVAHDGATADAIRRYVADRGSQGEHLGSRKDRSGDGVVHMESLRLLNAAGEPVTSVGSGEPLTVAVAYSTSGEAVQREGLTLDVRITDVLGHPITTFSTRCVHWKGDLGRRGALVCHIPSFALAHESYSIDLWMLYRGAVADGVLGAGEIQVVASRYFETGHQPAQRTHGAALFAHDWHAYPDLSPEELSAIAWQFSARLDRNHDAHLLPL
jgi:lipopolysaccharide transport system ATP-binding protein